ncbi:MAG: M23 family metallopeptidase [Myxococcota bacterium]|nr:M23 family metallopeptidase [Myxococcota bacterium]
MDASLEKPGLAEAMGLLPLSERLRQARVALRGEEDVPPSQYDLSSLGQLRPRIGVPLWLGRVVVPRRAIVTNLFNHRQTPIEAGWSVKRTQVLDFRGRGLTYDSHNGTDFSIPLGTPVVAAAAGEVVRVVSEFNRGGLKVFLDHGEGLMTNCAHLARALVVEGQRVARGEIIAVSGYSGLDGFVTFPFGTPHVHFNTWLDGEPVDPFPSGTDASLWNAGDAPAPAPADAVGEELEAPSQYDPERVDALVAACRTGRRREALEALEPLGRRAAHTIIESNYYPTRFRERTNPYTATHARRPRLDLPFRCEDFDGVVFADDL